MMLGELLSSSVHLALLLVNNLTIVLGPLVGIRCNWGKFELIRNILEAHMLVGGARFATYQNECLHCIISPKQCPSRLANS